MDAAPCGATIRIARVGASSNPDSPPYRLSAPGNGQIEILPDPASGGSADSDVVIANAPSGAQGRNVPFQIRVPRSEEHTSELPSLMRHSYDVFCLTNKTISNNK